MKRVVITGTGAISACGIGAEALWTAARDGRSGVRQTLFPTLKRQVILEAAPISGADYQIALSTTNPRFQDRVSAIAQIAAGEAIDQAGLGVADFGERCAVSIGAGFGGAQTMDENYHRLLAEGGSRKIDPMCVPKIMTNAPASWIAMKWGIKGPSYCISTACSSASQSIGLGAMLVASGTVDRCIAGGAEALLVPGVFASWEAMHVMTNDKCRPFSRNRTGMVLGDGAAMFVLESLESALARGSKILAEFAGYGTTNDAGDLLRPDRDGAARSMRMALDHGRLEPTQIGYVNAHGTGTIANDLNETLALRDVFGDRFAEMLISSTKPIHGHALGAGGALELLITLKALEEQIAPPTINFIDVDPKLGFEPVPNVARPFDADVVLSNSFAFGGVNASLALKRYEA
ncbi:MAG: beta-ketoacyl-[acyl-carrier-protein] synthase family protein [Hoeflea sp.]|nr:beta-ketoacyl-[acyl-carrier-protein] synthase family protein [Alphaproteobacteria bacterium]MBV1722864.1 beta-ketoacyl-[acyl-carrier-protein] synthase family protein [Hoeflea sp.]MBU4542747.1 beta-ketoacyl-[acyl-carrier-protein] synthase family protein [Alphaproteobacteria bacterium]MBU4552559.1 beta-ketoacyl-[acyl-carrier-protein] synthase family protein [Alphaproteobacteria bacterium]MBV1762775.1 beta-ketoacyl-[acyl-carrier-protein] synthase family protein [Hoeflea sp.]